MRHMTMFVAMIGGGILAAQAMARTNVHSKAAAKISAPSNVVAQASTPFAIGKFVYEGGDGSAMTNAVIIKNALNVYQGMEAEALWIKTVHPDWKKGEQAMRTKDGRNYDRIECTTPEGHKKVVYFDTTEFFAKY